MPSALYKINGNTAGVAQDVAAGSLVSLELADVRGVNTVTWSIIGTSENVSKPTITYSGIPSGITASFYVESTLNAAYGIKCTVNGGVDSAGNIDENLINTSAVYVLGSSGIRSVFIGEVYESNQVFGWIDRLNQIIDSAGSSTLPTDPVFNTIKSDGYVAADGYIRIGALPALSGDIRLTNNKNLSYRNAANSADIVGINLNGSDTLSLRDSALTLTSTQANFYSNSVRLGSSYVTIGTPSATAGAIRLPNATAISFRDAANSTNIDALSVDASNNAVMNVPVFFNYESSTCVLRSSYDSTTYAALYLGQTGLTPSASNYTIKSNGSNLFIQAASIIDFRTNGSTQRMLLTSSGLTMAVNTITFGSSLSGCNLTQTLLGTASATGKLFAVAAQSCNGANSTGGDLALSSGSGTLAQGSLRLQSGGVDSVVVNSTGTEFETPTVKAKETNGIINTLWFNGINNTGYLEDFIYPASSTTGLYPSGLVNNYAGTGAAVGASAIFADGNYGLVNCSTGTTTTGSSGIVSYVGSLCFGAGKRYCADYLNIPTLSDATNTYTIRAGWGDATGVTENTDGIFFRYTDTVNAGKWQAVTRSNGVETLTDTGITVAANTWYRLEIDVNAAGSSAVFYINGTSVATNTTNIPTGYARSTGRRTQIAKSAGTTSRLIYLDYMREVNEFTTPR